jgi:hypothetical protein
MTSAIADDDKLDRALALAALGFRVFPLVEGGKVPAIDGWQAKASSDPERIRRWWVGPVMGWEQDYNIGIATGHGLAVLDVDDKGDRRGSEALAALEREHGPLPATLVSRTPSGGRHIYLRVEGDVANSVSKLGDGLDVRGAGGLIVAPGSTTEKGAYEWAHGGDAEPAPMPAWLRARLSAAPVREAAPASAPAVELDTGLAIDLVRQYLEHEAPAAVEGDGGDHTTFKVAARCRDLGVSEPVALELMLEHWNERCSPPWVPDDLERKVGNAYRYGQNAPGSANPAADFGPVGEPAVADAGDTIDDQPTPLPPFQPSEIPPRQWVLGKLLIRRNVTVLVASPGMGKSTFVLSAMLAIASGRDDILTMPAHERCPVWYYNNEDDLDELKRRLAAAMQHHEVDWPDLTGPDGQPMLHLDTAEKRPLAIARRDPTGAVKAGDLDELIAKVKRAGIGVFIADPFVETHGADENDNGQIAAVARMYRRIAHETGCAVLVVHHTRKLPAGASDSHAGNLDSGRGASALMGVARVAATLYGMSEKDAKRLKVPNDERHRYVRLDQAKGNMSLSGDTAWFRRVSVPLALGNGTGDFEEVGALDTIDLAPPAEGSEGDAAGSGLSPQYKALLATLAKLSGAGAADEAGSADGLFVAGPWVTVENLEKACIAAGVTQSVGSIRNARRALAAAGLTENTGGRGGRARLTAKGREIAARLATGEGSA